MIAKKTRLTQRSQILKLLNYKLFDSNTQEKLKTYFLKES
eukprot:gene18469-22213_t